ncbi:YihY/virulence factor BrkB family protein [Methanolobus sp. ZRKC2]|uniref:YihY/virulence factor BrkB family protein n=1 Tax=Methanolobus sp. ZRKC2 TaxID=3125783 RepID=UPI00325307CA
MSKIKDIFMETYRRWSDYDGITDSAALAFIFLLSLPALILFTLSLGSMFLQQKALQHRIIAYVSTIASQTTVDTLNDLFGQLPTTGTTTLGLIISSLLLLWTATNLFRQLQKTINGMWNVEYHHETWYEDIIKKRLASVVAVFAFVLIIVLTTAFEFALLEISRRLNSLFPLSVNIIQYTSLILNFFILFMIFIYLYRVLPETRLDMKYVLTGSFMTALLITIGKYVFSLYLSISDPTSVYGSIGSMIAIFLWIYYSAIIVTIMIQFTKVYADIDRGVAVEKK